MDTPNTNTEIEKKVDPKQYRLILDMIKEVEDSYNAFKVSASSRINTMGLSDTIIEAILPYEEDKINSIDVSEIRDVINNNKTTMDVDSKSDDELVELFKEIKKMQLLLLTSRRDVEKLKAESNETLKDYFNYLSSARVRKAREERIDALKEAVDYEEDEVRKASMVRMINTMEASLDYSFLYDRFNEYGEKEIESIKNGFFNDKDGEYIQKKFMSKIKKFGYKEDIYKNFYGIEEKFLPEQYAPFNNIFLFIYIRMIAYGDPYSKTDRMLVESLTSGIANLIYHKFDSVESEQYFISVIESIDDKFIDDVEYFKENNSTYEFHPDRVKAQQEHDAHRREALIKSLTRLKVTDFDENMDIDELQKLYSDTVESMIDTQLEKEDSKNASKEEVSEDVDNEEPSEESVDSEEIFNEDDAVDTEESEEE